MMLLMRTGLVSFGQGSTTAWVPMRRACSTIGFTSGDLLLMVIAGAAARSAGRRDSGLAAGEVSRHLFRHAEPGVLDDSLRPAGEDLRARQHRRLRPLGQDLRRRPAQQRNGCATSSTRSLRCSPSYARPACIATSTRTWAGWPARSATTSCAWSTWAHRCATSIHLNYVISAALAGIGGALMAGDHRPRRSGDDRLLDDLRRFRLRRDPERHRQRARAVSRRGHLRVVRTFALQYLPNTWQMMLGITMLLVIMFLPGGLWSVFHSHCEGGADMAVVLEART